MATQYGGSASRGFSSSQLRLGRTESLKEFAQVLQKQTTGRMRQTAEGIGRSAVSAALAPLPGPLQASMYGMLTSNPFGGGVSGDTESTVEKISDDVQDLKNPKWATNLMRLYREPLPVKIVEDRLGALEAKRESMIDITPTVEKVEEDEKEEKKGFFGKLFDGFKKLFKFDGGLSKFLTTLLGGVGAFALGTLKFAKGLGLAGLLGTILFSDKIIKQLTHDFEKEAEKLDISVTGLRFVDFVTQGAEGGLLEAFKGAGTFGALGAAAGSVYGIQGIVVGGLIGAAIGGIVGFIGKNKLVDIVKFAETAYNETWAKAKVGWEKANLRDLEKERTSLEELKQQAEEEGDKSTAIKLRDKIIILNDQIRRSRQKLYLLELDSLRDERESYEERLKEITEDRERLLEAFPTKIKKTEIEDLFSKIDDLENRKLMVETKEFLGTSGNFDVKMEEGTRKGFGINLDQFLELNRDDQIDLIKKVKESAKLFKDDKVLDTIDEFFKITDVYKLQNNKILQEQVGKLQERVLRPELNRLLSDEEMSAKFRVAYEKEFGVTTSPEFRGGEEVFKRIQTDPERVRKIIESVYGRKIEESNILIKDIDDKLGDKIKQNPEDEDLTGSLYFDPRETLEAPIKMIGQSVENMVAMNTPSSLPPVMSDFGNQSTIVEGSRNQYDTKVFNQIFQTDSDRMAFGIS